MHIISDPRLAVQEQRNFRFVIGLRAVSVHGCVASSGIGSCSIDRNGERDRGGRRDTKLWRRYGEGKGVQDIGYWNVEGGEGGRDSQERSLS